jgi:Arc/MetJ-type ribon-helix-helix transcriptional regulator
MGFGKKRSSKVGVGAITTNKKKLFAEGGMMDDGKDVDPVSGNDVPTGSLAEEVRDDVDAKLSPGEFVIPADVVRFIGLERLMKMRDEAKKGLARMNDIGQMGNAEEAGEAADDTYEEDDDFESEIDDIMKEVDKEETGRQTEMAFNAGGFVNPSYYDLEKAPKNPALDIRYFNDSEGKTFYMPFINGKPMKPMPNGAVQTGMPTGKSTIPTTPKDVTTSSSDLKDLRTSGTLLGGGASTIISTGTTKAADDTKAGAGTSVGVAGTYTGSNIADFGRSDLIYNPGGSGAGGEIVGDDLWNSSISKLQVNLGSAALSTLAAAMGVPGILTMGFRAASNKFGVNAVNAFLADANQKMVAKAGGIDLNRTEPVAGFTIDPISGKPTFGTSPIGVAAAASQIDQLGQLPGDGGKFAATSGAIGTGGRAADVGAYVAQSLVGTGLSDAQIATAAQEAANAVINGKSLMDAVSQTMLKYNPEGGTTSAVGLGDEGSLYEGLPGSWGDFDIDVNMSTAPSVSPASIGFDYSSFDSIDFGTSMPQTKTTPKSQQKEEEGNRFYDDSYRTRQVLAQMESILGRKQSFEQ